ncbi:MAG: LysM peptidoglycan-binding domain-containing protein [Deltaproteobacteria bacterium]
MAASTAPVPATLSWEGTHGRETVSGFVNPAEISFEKAVQLAEVNIPGLDSPIVQFVRGRAETLNVELFFDTTDNGMGSDAVPVTRLTDRVYQLVKIRPETHAPPIVTFAWSTEGFPGSKLDADFGSQKRNDFVCVVERVQQRFTLFSSNGVPLRAILTVALKEYKTLEEQLKELNLKQKQTKIHQATERDTVARVAASAYGDAGSWRTIAEANDLDDPLDIPPGVPLRIPPMP